MAPDSARVPFSITLGAAKDPAVHVACGSHMKKPHGAVPVYRPAPCGSHRA